MMLRQREPRQKNDKHLKFIRCLSCVVCANNICTEAAHVKMAAPGKRNVGIGEKADDKWTVPLCGACHRKQHAWGEREFWETVCIKPLQLAADLFAVSGDHEAGERIVSEYNAQSLMLLRH
jgi:hypothetical protein